MLGTETEISTDELARLNEGPRETDPYGGGVTQALAGDSKESKSAFYSLEDADIRVLQKEIDKKSLTYIKLAQEQGLIGTAEANYLTSYYQDTMTLYGKFYDILISALGHPQSCRRNDLEEGEIDDKNYSETYITPSNSMVLTYSNLITDPDLEESNVALTLPGMKSVVRAVEKIRKGGKYDQAYHEDMKKLDNQYPDGGEEYQQAQKKIMPAHVRLKDILRATISVPTYEMIDKVISKIMQKGNFEIVETRDKFHANRSAQDKNFYDNKKNYRDKKICFNKNGYYFEIQFKVQHLEKADKLSHPYYERLRKKLDEYSNEPQENIERRQKLRREITWLEWDIQSINRKGIDDYNAFILATAQKKDIRIKKEKIRQLRQQYADIKDERIRASLQKEIYQESQALNAAPVSKEAEKFIENNFMVRPYKAIDKQREFEDYSPAVQNFAMLNYFLVSERYRGSISGRLPENYNDKYQQAYFARKQAEQKQFEQECCQYEQFSKRKLFQHRQSQYRN